jgi:hypothetical protein
VHNIEGFNTADLGWGTANAQAITVSFRVKSSLTGTFSVAFRNSANNRSYVTTYAISAANTWETKTVTIPGDTSGTWLTNNGIGISLIYRIGGSGGTSSTNQWTATSDAFASGSVNVMGTANATWQITGVQLEVGSVATPFERREYGRELMLCQRYFHSVGGNAYEIAGSMGNAYTTTYCFSVIHPQVTMRAAPTLTKIGNWGWNDWTNSPSASGALTIATNETSTKAFFVFSNNTSSGLTGLRSYYLQASNDTTARLQFSAEL